MSEQQPGFGISKTIPKKEGPEAVAQLYDGSIDTYEFHMNSSIKKVSVGDWVYTIFDNALRGRCRITDLIDGETHPCSGQPRTLVMVECPGQQLAEPIPMKGHMGTRYYDGSDWPA